MAASIFQKLLRNQSQSTRTTTRIIISNLTTTTATPTTVRRLLISSQPIQTQLFGQPKTQDSNVQNASQSIPIFPSFSLEYFLNPTSSTGFIVPESDGVASGEADNSSTIWADSVKKKRKRKMNKHKLRKLRRSLRKKT